MLSPFQAEDTLQLIKQSRVSVSQRMNAAPFRQVPTKTGDLRQYLGAQNGYLQDSFVVEVTFLLGSFEYFHLRTFSLRSLLTLAKALLSR